MGQKSSSNASSSENVPVELLHEVDLFAAEFILTSSFQNLRRLTQSKYCDQLVATTDQVLQTQLKPIQVAKLRKRLQGEPVKFAWREEVEETGLSGKEKQAACREIAKFYTKIAHLFAAIIMTLNPIYVFRDKEGRLVKSSWKHRNAIPNNPHGTTILSGMCDARINALQFQQGDGDLHRLDDDAFRQHYRHLYTGLCSASTRDTLDQEPGMPELAQLYFDDQFDRETGQFRGMSPESMKQYQKHLKIFYRTFTGEKEVPRSVRKFSDIKLRNLSRSYLCGQDKDDAYFRKELVVSKHDARYQEYARSVQRMVKHASANRTQLMSVINDLFEVHEDPETQARTYAVHRELTEERLSELVVKTRKLLVDIYVTCEEEYQKSIQLYQAIVEHQILTTSKRQIQRLEEELHKSSSSSLATTPVDMVKEEEDSENQRPPPIPDVQWVSSSSLSSSSSEEKEEGMSDYSR